MPDTALPTECLISVDVEAAGPIPARYSLLSIGACLVAEPEHGFYVELQPVQRRADPQASAIHGLSLERLAAEGMPPSRAMAAFETWIQTTIGGERVPVFVGFNAAFDWMFVADYFHRYLGRNPFGHAPLDIKAYYMGLSGGPFLATSRRQLAARYPDMPRPEHNALQDALDQAELLRRMMAARSRLPAADPLVPSLAEAWQPDGSYILRSGDPHE